MNSFEKEEVSNRFVAVAKLLAYLSFRLENVFTDQNAENDCECIAFILSLLAEHTGKLAKTYEQ